MPLFNIINKSKYSTLRIPRDAKNKKREIPEGLWLKCKKCTRTLYKKQLAENLNICPHCRFHSPLKALDRIRLLTDQDSFIELDAELTSVDPLQFSDAKSYAERLRQNIAKTGLKEGVVCGTATLNKLAFALAVMDFRFLGASMGSAMGEKITRLFEKALELKIPAVMVTASGGARMQEGILSLMQMPKTSAALERLAAAGLPYLVILTNPTYGGVTASYATLGDVIIAEPGAMIGFAGPRVIRETTNSELPEGFQTAEFLLSKGLIDRVIPRNNLRREVSLLLEYLSG